MTRVYRCSINELALQQAIYKSASKHAISTRPGFSIACLSPFCPSSSFRVLRIVCWELCATLLEL